MKLSAEPDRFGFFYGWVERNGERVRIDVLPPNHFWRGVLYRVLRAILHWRREAYCSGVDRRAMPDLREVYGHLNDYSETGKLPLFKDFRSADCVGPDGKRWEGQGRQKG